MPSKSTLKLVRSLRQKKYRKVHGLFVAEGQKLCAELLAGDFDVQYVFATAEWLAANQALLTSAGVPVVEEVNTRALEQLSSLQTPNEALVVARIPSYTFDAAACKNELVLGLENLRDPGNMGTIVRLADWFGIKHIVCTPESVDLWNPKVVQASMGSILRVQVHQLPLETAVSTLRAADAAYPVYATVLGGVNMYQAELAARGLIFMGNESAGLSANLAELASQQLAIPGKGGAESLNVGIACGVVVAEFVRRME